MNTAPWLTFTTTNLEHQELDRISSNCIWRMEFQNSWEDRQKLNSSSECWWNSSVIELCFFVKSWSFSNSRHILTWRRAKWPGSFQMLRELGLMYKEQPTWDDLNMAEVWIVTSERVYGWGIQGSRHWTIPGQFLERLKDKQLRIDLLKDGQQSTWRIMTNKFCTKKFFHPHRRVMRIMDGNAHDH